MHLVCLVNNVMCHEIQTVLQYGDARSSGLAHWFVRDSNAAGGAGLGQAIALHHRAAEAHFQELLHMVGQGGPTCHNQAHMTPQAGLDLGKDQPVEERGSLQVQAIVRLGCDNPLEVKSAESTEINKEKENASGQ